MIPVEEFIALQPEHAQNDDENALMVARIEHERTEREALEQQRMELLKRKQKLIADNKKRKDDLANLDKELEKFIDVSYFTFARVCPCCFVILLTMISHVFRPQNRFRACSTRTFSQWHEVFCDSARSVLWRPARISHPQDMAI